MDYGFVLKEYRVCGCWIIGFRADLCCFDRVLICFMDYGSFEGLSCVFVGGVLVRMLGSCFFLYLFVFFLFYGVLALFHGLWVCLKDSRFFLLLVGDCVFVFWRILLFRWIIGLPHGVWFC